MGNAWFNVDPEALFAGLLATPEFAALGLMFLGIGAAFLTIGTILGNMHAKDHDQRMMVWTKALMIIAFFFLAPPMLSNIRTLAWETQYQMGVAPNQLAFKCAAVGIGMPEMDKVFSSISGRDKAIQSAGRGYKAADWILDHVGTNWFGQMLANRARQADGAINLLTQPLEAFKLGYEIIGSSIRAVLKTIVMGVLFLFLKIAMILIGMVAIFMTIVQEFLLIMGTMLLPVFIGMFAMGGSWAQSGRHYCTHLFCVATWNLVWTFGSFGTVALFNFTANSVCSAFGLTQNTIQWDSAVGKFTQFADNMQTASAGGVAALQVQSDAMDALIQGPIMNMMIPCIGAVFMIAWTLYTYIKLPFVYTQLVHTGADMVMSGAQQGAQGAEGAATAAATAAAKAAVVAAL